MSQKLEDAWDLARQWAKLTQRIQSREFDMDGPGDQATFERLMAERRECRKKLFDLVLACPNEDCHHFPMYGMAPHKHERKDGESYIGTTRLDARETWPANFFEDPEAPGCGTYVCPDCKGTGRAP